MLNIFHYLLIALGLNVFLFIPAYIFKTDKLTDLSYSLTFIVLIWLAFFFNVSNTFKLILALMVTLWGLRLGIFLFVRIRKMKRDKRFDGIRENFWRFLKFWVLQGLAVWVILIPSFFKINSGAGRFCIIGLLIWLIGLLTETIADLQKYKFIGNRKNKGKFIDVGLWKYSRHPNYFGEITCWVGIYIFAILSLTPIENVIALASPLFIAILLIFVTGLPPLEKFADKKWGKQKDYKEYKRRTSILIPWFRKK